MQPTKIWLIRGDEHIFSPIGDGMMAVLELENLHKRFGDFTALEEVSFSVPEGSIFGLLGPNGAGKTTTIRLINRIYLPDGGHIRMEGRPMKAASVYRIGYMPEERGLYKKMKVGEQLRYLGRLRGLDRATAQTRVAHWLERLEMDAWQNHRMQELSKGMQQKIQFIATVLHQPRLLILDEPFSGFDPVNTERIIREMERLRQEGATLILSTHRMESVEQLCSHVAMINHGRKVLSGEVDAVRHRYKRHHYRLRGYGHLPPGTLEAVEGVEVLEAPVAADDPSYLLALHRPGASNEVLQAAARYLQIAEFRELLPSMHEVFVQNAQSQAVDHG